MMMMKKDLIKILGNLNTNMAIKCVLNYGFYIFITLTAMQKIVLFTYITIFSIILCFYYFYFIKFSIAIFFYYFLFFSY